MVRRGLIAVALAASFGGYVIAIERGTFVLIDGERKSGTIVFHTDSRENLINNHLNLGTDDGRELTFPIDQVAVIDFVGGRPPARELDALPSDNSMHVLVLRNGYLQQGHLINLIGGDTVRWRNAGGEEQQYAIRDVNRIYLNAERARTAFNYSGLSAGAIATSGQPAGAPITIRVPAARPWTDTGLNVVAGQHVSFQASGQLKFAYAADATAGPDGGSMRLNDYPVPSVPVGALIGRIGNGAPFGIGTQTQPPPMPASGRLQLGTNDNNFDDNSGFFTVVVTPQS
jgi:hypothetical protein